MRNQSYVAHEQIATSMKMFFAMIFSGLLVAVVLWLIVLFAYHNSITRSLKTIQLPLVTRDDSLMTFAQSGIFKQISQSDIIAAGLAQVGEFLIVLPEHSDYEAIKSRSRAVPANVIDYLIPFGGTIWQHLSSPFLPSKPISVDFKMGKGAMPLFKEKSVNVPDSLVGLLPAGEMPKSELFNSLDKKLAGALTRARARSKAFFFWSFLIFPSVLVFWFFSFKKLSKKKKSEKILRGAKLLSFEKFCARLNLLKSENGFSVGELKLPRDFETSHFLILGTTGSGKSVLLNQFIKQIYHRGEKAVIYDVKGEFLSKHAELDKDLIFYPFDIRSVAWSLFNEIRHKPDFDMLATALLQPPKESQDKYWYDSARDVFRAGLLFLYLSGNKKNRDIIDFFNQPMPGILAALNTLPIEERSALKHIDGDARPAMGIMSTLQSCIPFLRYIADKDGSFSFRDFIRDESDKRRLYLLNIRNYEPIFKPLQTFIIDIMIREVLSLKDNRDTRFFFVIDEFASLGKLSSVFDFIGMARSKGGSLLLANQDLGAIESTYGRPLLKTFYNNLSNKFILRIEDPETSRFLSDAFGEREIIKKIESRSMSPAAFGDRHTISDQDKIEKILLQSQFQDLKDFEAYVKLGKIGISRLKIPQVFMEERLDHFIIDETAFRIFQPEEELKSITGAGESEADFKIN